MRWTVALLLIAFIYAITSSFNPKYNLQALSEYVGAAFSGLEVSEVMGAQGVN